VPDWPAELAFEVPMRHQSLEMDAPNRRPVHAQDCGEVVEFPEVGGLHHHYGAP
jgi:hypothetical protein